MKSYIEVLQQEIENSERGGYQDILVNRGVLSHLILVAMEDAWMPLREAAFRELNEQRAEDV